MHAYLSRLYHQLDKLVPLTAINVAYYAPAKLNDISLYCTIEKISESITKVEISNDKVVDGIEFPSPWMIFYVDSIQKIAELTKLHDEWKINTLYSKIDDRVDLNKNILAINWLSGLAIHGLRFVPVIPNSIVTTA